jgi:O-antigen/teichoic acid export membrane protein
MILAKLGSPEVVGTYALALSIVIPVLAFTGFQLREVLATDVQHRHPFASYLRLRIATAAVAFAAISLIGIALLSDRDSFAVLIAVATGRVAENISEILYGRLQRDEQMSMVGVFISARCLSALAVLGSVMWFSQNAILAIWASSSISVLMLIFIELPRAGRRLDAEEGLRTPETWDAIWPLLSASLPLAVVTLMNSLAIHAPRYFIAGYVGKAELGAYAVIHSTLSAFYLLQSSIGAAAMSRMARYFNDRERRLFLHLVARILLIGLALSTMVVAAVFYLGGWILEHLYSRDYAAYATLFNLMAVNSALVCIAGAFSFFLHTMRKFSANARISTVNALCVASMSFLLVPTYGSYGAVGAIAVGAVVSLLLATHRFIQSAKSLNTLNP